MTSEEKDKLATEVLNRMIGKDYYLTGNHGGYVKVVAVVDKETVTVVDKYSVSQDASIYDLRAV